jgi:hypothetical protein
MTDIEDLIADARKYGPESMSSQLIRKLADALEAQQAKITAALNHDPLHGADSGLHCGGMAPCIRRILSDAPTETDAEDER